MVHAGYLIIMAACSIVLTCLKLASPQHYRIGVEPVSSILMTLISTTNWAGAFIVPQALAVVWLPKIKAEDNSYARMKVRFFKAMDMQVIVMFPLAHMINIWPILSSSLAHFPADYIVYGYSYWAATLFQMIAVSFQAQVTGAILVSDIEKMLHANPHQKVSKFIGLVAKKGKVVLYKMNAPYIIVSLVMWTLPLCWPYMMSKSSYINVLCIISGCMIHSGVAVLSDDKMLETVINLLTCAGKGQAKHKVMDMPSSSDPSSASSSGSSSTSSSYPTSSSRLSRESDTMEDPLDS